MTWRPAWFWNWLDSLNPPAVEPAPVAVKPPAPPVVAVDPLLPAPVVITTPAVKPTVPGNWAMGLQGTLCDPSTAFVNDFKQITTAPEGSFVGTEINASWASMNPGPGLYNWSPLDNALDALSKGIVAGHRNFRGVFTPPWVSEMVGTITLPNKHVAKHPTQNLPANVTFPKYWTPKYYDCEVAFWTALLARYDNDERLVQIDNGLGSSWTNEIFNCGGDPDIRALLKAAGCTDAALSAMWENTASLFGQISKRTNILTALGMFGSIDNPNAPASPMASQTLMLSLRSALGSRAILANQGYQLPAAGGVSTAADNTRIMMGAQGGAIEGQADGPTIINDDLVALMLSQGVTQFEVFPNKAAGGDATYDSASLPGWNARFIANAARISN